VTESFFRWLFENGDKITVVALLLTILVVVLLAVYREWIISGNTHRWIVARFEEEIKRTRDDCQQVRAQNDRLMAAAERTITATETVARAVQRRERDR
jgi:DNA recombination-dependent growth factor C